MATGDGKYTNNSRFDAATFEKYISYQTNIKPEDISDSLSSPLNISVQACNVY